LANIESSCIISWDGLGMGSPVSIEVWTPTILPQVAHIGPSLL
jgi:hypothetical protein